MSITQKFHANPSDIFKDIRTMLLEIEEMIGVGDLEAARRFGVELMGSIEALKIMEHEKDKNNPWILP